MRHHLKWSAMICCILAITIVLAGCGTAATPTSTQPPTTTQTTTAGETAATTAASETSSWLQDVSTPVTVTLFYDKVMPTTIFDQYWGKDVVSKKWIAETGVNIDFLFPPDNEHSKLNVLIASGALPDIMVVEDSLPIVQKLVENDKIWSINELAAQAAPGFIERNLGDHVMLAHRIAWNSMDIYGLPVLHYSAESLKDPNIIKNTVGMAVIQQIYEELGSPDTTTVDGFLNLLRKVKQKYPEMIPAQSSRNSTRDSDGNVRLVYKLFPVFDLAGRYDKIDGKYVKYWYSPKYLELLKFVNTLYNERLIDPTEFTDQGEQLQGKEFSGMVFCDMNQDSDNIDWFSDELKKVQPEQNFIMIDPPSAYADTPYSSDGIGGGTGSSQVAVISKDSKYADRCLQFYDYIYQPEQQLNLYRGLQGDAWEYDAKGFAAIFKDIETATDDIKKAVHGVGAYWLFRDANVSSAYIKYNVSEYKAYSLDLTNKYYKDLSFYTGAERYASDSQEIKVFSSVKEYYEVTVMSIITGPTAAVESRYQAMIAQIESLGQPLLNESINNYFTQRDATIAKYSEGLFK